MYQLYSSIAPRPEDWSRLLNKLGEVMKKDFDLSKENAAIKAPTLVVAGDADIFPPADAVELFGRNHQATRSVGCANARSSRPWDIVLADCAIDE